MFDPAWEAGCKHCSFWADGFDDNIVHINHRDATMIAVSRAPYSKLASYEKRMGWNFKWLSAHESDFNFDYNVSFTPEEVAKKQAFYNFQMQNPGGWSTPESAYFSKTRMVTYSTPIPRIRGASICSTPPTTILTSLPKAATRVDAINIGCAAMTNTPHQQAAVRSLRACWRLLPRTKGDTCQA